MNRYSLSLIGLFFAAFSKAQDAAMNEPQMADKFRSDGKIYVVITVIAMIFAAIVIFIALLDKKIRKIETKIVELEKINPKS